MIDFHQRYLKILTYQRLYFGQQLLECSQLYSNGITKLVAVMQLQISHKTIIVGTTRRVFADNNAPRPYDAVLFHLQRDK